MDALLGQHVDLGRVRKIGEGTFGEAFKAGRVVFKIVPMEGSVLVSGWAGEWVKESGREGERRTGGAVQKCGSVEGCVLVSLITVGGRVRGGGRGKRSKAKGVTEQPT